jgi:hypothetical protein
MRLLSFILLFTLVGCSCSKEEEDTILRQDLYRKAKLGDENVRFKMPKSIGDTLVNCYEYVPRCKFGYIVIVKELEVKALEYETIEGAKKSAKRIQGYRAANWVFDDVAGEPVLEWYVKKYLGAKKAE